MDFLQRLNNALKRNGIGEDAPPGWKGTVKKMKGHKEIDNPFALAWSMKKKGAKPHYTNSDKPHKKKGED